MMEKITLAPGVWTRIHATDCFQSRSNRSGIRVHYGVDEPAPDTDLYFVTQEYEVKPFGLIPDRGSMNVYLMPNEQQSVDVVVL
ncbi:hypothetical protein ACC755_21260 [Rhizobium ruizarguesonis]|uniref:hypothetical protein n=2 Tax=Rhizobium TaxID=379 RepID=UPI00102F7E24|nr:hypothetical protein [Rhizobium ruizarguesonis]TAY93605.1 hypothetical protein ELH85_10700 [Rhizobium ruizarguesonis]